MSKNHSWFVEKRAEARAFLLLTDRPDLRVSRPEDDTGIGYEVELLHDQEPTGRFLGIQVKGTMDSLRSADPLKLLNSTGRLPSVPVTMPVCLFLFSVREDQGLYGWLLKPEVMKGGEPRLAFQEHPVLFDLNAKALDEIVKQTDRYYDALLLALKGSH